MYKVLWLILLSLVSSFAYTKEPFRIVVLSPNLTEITHSIIQQAESKNTKIVGVIHYQGEPDYTKPIQGVGSANSLSIEKIILLNPDIVLASPMNSPITIDQIKNFDIKIKILDANTLAEINELILDIGNLIQLQTAAQEISSQYLTKLAKLKKTYVKSHQQSVFIQISQIPIFTVGNKGIINEIINLCHGHNIFSNIPYPSFQTGVEQVLKANPNLIFQLFYDLGKTELYTVNKNSQWQSWKNLSAVTNDKIYNINPNLISQNSPKILEGAETICRLIAQKSIN